MGEHNSTNAYTGGMCNFYFRNTFGFDVSLKTDITHLADNVVTEHEVTENIYMWEYIFL